ncbi:MAG: polysaccharide biosynthesis protein, partial [Cetobacterium sp.]
SVIPIFKKLIDEGKNLTITHPEITRYFMTIPEAAQLVIEAGSLGEGGELFVLDMGKPVKILDLARNMIKLSNANIDIDFVGLRPGEKLYEELLYDVRLATKTENDKIFIAKIDSIDMNIDLDYHLKKLEDAVKNPDVDEIKALMKDMVVTYKEENYEKSDQPLSA